MIKFLNQLFSSKRNSKTKKGGRSNNKLAKSEGRTNWQDTFLMLTAAFAFTLIALALLMERGIFLGSNTNNSQIVTKIEAVAKTVTFNDQEFDVFVLDQPSQQLKLYWENTKKAPIRNLGDLKEKVEASGQKLVFGMNAGMFTPSYEPQGLYVAEFKEEVPLENANEGYGNFFLMPNGVFAFDADEAVVQERVQFLDLGKKYQYATQSGPMLVIDGDIHPAFNKGSKNLHIRNGVGVTDNGKIVFAISKQRVNFYTFAALFKEVYHCPNALYLDGAISQLYLPELGRFDTIGNLGPIIGVTNRKSERLTYKKRKVAIQSGTYDFNGKSFDVYLYPLAKKAIQFFLKDEQNRSYVGIPDLKRALAKKGKKLLFATNGGSYNQQLEPEGLLINEGEKISSLNLNHGKGNFYLKPNGVFAITDDNFLIKRSEAYGILEEDIRFATQSGPLLIENGKIHLGLTKGSKNLNIRNGIGLIDDHHAVFVISNEPINFYDFATFFKEKLGCANALYLDGSNSTMYAPGIGRKQLIHKSKLGPIIAITSDE